MWLQLLQLQTVLCYSFISWYVFQNIILKTKHNLYIALGSDRPPAMKSSEFAPADNGLEKFYSRSKHQAVCILGAPE